MGEGGSKIRELKPLERKGADTEYSSGLCHRSIRVSTRDYPHYYDN